MRHIEENIKTFKELIEEELKVAPDIKKQSYDAKQRNIGKTTAEINKENVEKSKSEGKEKPKDESEKDENEEKEPVEENVKTFKELLAEGRLAPEIKAQVFASRQKNKGKTTAEINKENVEKVKAEKEEPKKEEPKKEEEKEMVEEGVKKFRVFVKENIDGFYNGTKSKVEIVKCDNPKSWYYDSVKNGETLTYEVVEDRNDETNWKVVPTAETKGQGVLFIKKDDCKKLN
jgi:hypothetical protein